MQDTAPQGFIIAGARVLRAFESGGERVPAGTVISAEDYQAMGHASRRVMVKNGQLHPFYVPVRTPGVDVQRHIIHRGAGRYDVVEGTMLNAEPLTRDEAEALAAPVQ